MADYVSFCVSDVMTFQNGVRDASSSMTNVSYEVESEAREAENKGESILKKADRIFTEMNEDRRAATEVRTHNEQVLELYKKKLSELDYQYEQLRKAYSRAYDEYRRACAEETRIHNTSVPSTGDAEADKRARDDHAKALAAARKWVREADHLCYEIKQQQAAVLRNIEIVKRNIETIREIIQNLNDFIRQIDGSIQELEHYTNRLKSAMRDLRTALGRFDSVYRNCSRHLDAYVGSAGAAISYGRNICNCMDPDQAVPDHDGCVIAFSDIYALDKMANTLTKTCNDYEDSADHIRERVNAHEDTMQDAVIAQGAATVYEVREKCTRKMAEFRKTARNCKEGGKNLQAYADLSP